MKKHNKILDKVKYEENPWGKGVKPSGKPIKDFLPPPSVMKNASVSYIDNDDEELDDMALPCAEKDLRSLLSKSKKAGLSPRAFVIGVMHDFLHGNLVRPNG